LCTTSAIFLLVVAVSVWCRRRDGELMSRSKRISAEGRVAAWAETPQR